MIDQISVQCPCGRLITEPNGSEYRAYMLAEVDRAGLYDAIEERIINRLADGQITKEQARILMRKTVFAKLRSMWQCRDCNAIHVHDGYSERYSYVPGEGNDVGPVFFGR